MTVQIPRRALDALTEQVLVTLGHARNAQGLRVPCGPLKRREDPILGSVPDIDHVRAMICLSLGNICGDIVTVGDWPIDMVRYGPLIAQEEPD